MKRDGILASGTGVRTGKDVIKRIIGVYLAKVLIRFRETGKAAAA